ncbi:MAG: gliding motility-associated ABC transporter ATP-binding subunit GldA [Saprospiraceae bacterium]|nr:gliding motility-associated ABC transporter ATP-binding subunit GldA [Saprospiraceae bacterium]
MSVVVEGLTKIYGTQHAVDQISFEAKKGEILGFLGPNGAGKTTTMKVITCFIPPTMGSVSVCGFDVEKNPMEVRRSLGYLPEHNPLYKEMYVREYLQFIARLHGDSKARVDEMIELTGLQRESHKLIETLSKGYRQRVGLAQALLHDPEVLILDEPTSGLDPNQLVEIRQLIKKIGEEKTVIFSTHIMQEVQALCDRVLIINQGKLVADDPIERLQERMSGRSLVTVEFSLPVNKQELEAIKGVDGVKSLGKNRWELTASSKTDIREAIFQFAVSNKKPLLELHKEQLSVENVFQHLTQSPIHA